MSAIKPCNPFVTGRYVSRYYFCDREKETDFLRRNVMGGRNVALISPRRLGKTGLIEHLFAQEDIRSSFFTIFIDIYATTSLSEFVYKLGKAVFAELGRREVSVVEKFFGVVKSLRVGFHLDSVTGEPSFDISLGSISSAETTLEEIFQYIDMADRPCLIAIDEFQQISAYEQKNVEATLRTHIQHCKNATFIFAGSRRHVMSQMFHSASKPFYQSAITMGLAPIPQAVYASFVERMFAQHGKSIDAQVVNEAYELTSGCTWYLQVLMNELFALTPDGERCETDMMAYAKQNIIANQGFSYSELMSMVGSKQKAVLLAIATEGAADKITSGAFIHRHSLPSASSVQSAVRGLMEKDIVTQDDAGRYRIYDPFFRIWLREQF